MIDNYSDLYDTTQFALRLSLDPLLPKERRIEVENTIIKLKIDPNFLKTLMRIISEDFNQSDENIKSLSLSLFNEWIKSNWNKLNENEHLQIKEFIFSISASYLGNSESPSIRNKLAIIMSNIAKRIFPQFWESFVSDMLEIWSKGSYNLQYVAIKSLEFLITDCTDSDFNTALPTIRRQDLITGLKAFQEPLLNKSYYYLNESLSSCQNIIDENERRKTMELIDSSLNLVISLASLVLPEELCAGSHDFSDAISILLNFSETQIKAIELVGVISTQKLPNNLFFKIFCILGSNPISSFPENIYDQLEFQYKYGTLIGSFMNKNIEICLSAEFLSNESNLQHLYQYFQLMVELIKLPSWKLSLELLKDWIKIFKHPSISDMKLVNDLLSAIMKEYFEKCKAPKKDNEVYMEVFEVEFEDPVDWSDFGAIFKSQYKQLNLLLFERFPMYSAQVYTNLMTSLIQIDATSSSENDRSSLVQDFDNIILVYGSLLNTLYPSIESQASVPEDLFLPPLNLLIEWHPVLPEIVISKFRLLSLHGPLLNRSNELLLTVLMLFFKYLDPNENANPLSHFTHFKQFADLKVKFKISSYFSLLSESCAKSIAFSGFINDFLNEVSNLLNSMNEYDIKDSMRETLVVIAEKVVDISLKEKIYSIALNDVLGKWTSNDGSENSPAFVFSNEESLYITLIKQAEGLSNALHEIKALADSLLVVTKKIPSPELPDKAWEIQSRFSAQEYNGIFSFSGLWDQCLPIIFQCINSLHSLWKENIRSSLLSSYSSGNSYQRHVVEILYHPRPVEVFKEAGIKFSDEERKERDDLYLSLRNIRSVLYSLVSHACIHKVIYFSNGLPHFLSCLEVHIPYLENVHLSMLLKQVVEPLILNSVSFSFPSISQFMGKLMLSMLKRISIAWDRDTNSQINEYQYFIYRHSGIPDSFCNIGANELEIAKDRIICDMSRIYWDLFYACFGLKGILAVQPKLKSEPLHSERKSHPESSTPIDFSFGNSPLPALGNTHSHDSKSTKEFEQKEHQKEIRKSFLQYLLVESPNLFVSQAFLSSIIIFICIPDSITCRKALFLGNLILSSNSVDRGLYLTFAKESFNSALMVLLQQEKWSFGLEWDIIEFIVEVYFRLVFGRSSEDSKIANLPTSSQMPLLLSDEPRKILLAINGISIQSVENLEKDLVRLTSRKKQRGVFRDFIMSQLPHFGQTSENNKTDSSLKVTIPSIMNVRQRFQMAGKSKQKQEINLDSFDLESFFNSK